MDWQKTVLIAGMAIVAWLLVIQWNQFQDNQIELSQANLVQEPTYSSDSEPSGFLENGNLDSELPLLQQPISIPQQNPERNRDFIIVKNNVVEVTIDTLGGDIVEAKLLKHLDKMPNLGGQPLAILQQNNTVTYIAKSGLIGPNPQIRITTDLNFHRQATAMKYKTIKK